MNHHLIKAAAKWLVPFFWMAGIFMLFRGHNEPGGGFIGGLIVGAAMVMSYIKVKRRPDQFKVLGTAPSTIIGLGLLLALSSGFLSFIQSGAPYMTSSWQGELWLPILGNTKFGTPFYFDTGVFLVVIGVISKVFLMLEEESWK